MPGAGKEQRADDRKTRRRAKHEGLLLDFGSGAAFLGVSENELRHLLEAGLIPYRKLGSRVMFVRAELETFIVSAPGISLDQALENVARKASR